MKHKPDVKATTTETLLLAKKGDRAALTQVFFDVDPLAAWWARRRARGDDVLFQDYQSIARLAVFQALKTFNRSRGNWSSWVTQYMKTYLQKETIRKHHTSEVRGVEADFPDDVDAADLQLEREERDIEVRKAVANLPLKMREMVRARMLGESLPGIAARLEMSKQGAWNMEQRAHEWLRTRLAHLEAA